MKNLTKTMETASGRRSRQTRFKLVFPDLNGLTLTSYRSADPLAWPLILKAGSYSGTITPDEGKADISSVIVEVMDDDRFHQALPSIRRREQAHLYAGCGNVLEDDWTMIVAGIVEDVPYQPEEGVYKLRLNNLRYFEIGSVFRSFGKTHLNGAIAAGDAVITVDSTDGTATGDAAFHDDGAAVDSYLLIDKEIIKPTARGAAQFTGCARGQLGIAGGGAAAAHADNAEVKELLVMQANPIDIALMILTSTGAGTNGAYDLLEADQGLGIPENLIDTSAFEAERDRYLIDDEYRFVLKEDIDNASTWIESEIYKTVNGYPIVTGEGRISFKLYNPPFDYEPESLTADQVIELSDYNRGLDKIVNLTKFKWDWSAVDGEFHTTRFDVQTDSVNAHGLAKTWVCEARGLYSDLQAEVLVGYRAARLFLRYAQGVPTFSAEVDLGKLKWDQGDIVNVSLAKLPDTDNGVMGFADRLHELVEVKPDLTKGSIEMELWDTRFSGRAGYICPNTYPDWMNATEEQRHGFYISDGAGLLPDGQRAPVLI